MQKELFVYPICLKQNISVLLHSSYQEENSSYHWGEHVNTEMGLHKQVLLK